MPFVRKALPLSKLLDPFFRLGAVGALIRHVGLYGIAISCPFSEAEQRSDGNHRQCPRSTGFESKGHIKALGWKVHQEARDEYSDEGCDREHLSVHIMPLLKIAHVSLHVPGQILLFCCWMFIEQAY